MPSPFHIVTTLLNLFAISSLIRRIVSRYEKVSEEPVVEAEKHIIPTQHRSKTTTSMSKWKRRSFLKEQKLCEKKTEKGSKERPRDWPNDIGFEFHQDVITPTKLNVIGKFPDYVRGVLYRIGPGGHQLQTESKKTYSIDHLFDAFTQIHRFHIIDSATITYNSRHTCDDLIQTIRKQGNMGDRFSFAQKRDPCKSFFHKFITMFKDGFDPTLEPEKNASNANIGVTVSTDFPGLSPTAKDRSSRNLYAKTDSCTLQALDPDSLEPVGITKQEHLHPDLKGSLSAAHARSDPVTGDIFNFNLEFGSTPTWRIFKVEKASGKTSILATITDCPGAYIHSFFLTGKYVVLCVWNSYFSMNGLSVLYHRNILDALQPYDETKKNRWYVIDRSEKQEGVVGVYESESFYAFHSINAWDEGDDIVCELPVYWSMDILKKFYLHNLLGSSEEALKWFDKGRPIFTRWRLKKVIEGRVLAKCKGKKHSNGMKIRSAVREFTADVMDSMELPTINPNYATKPTRFTYGLNSKGASTFMESIIKYDTSTTPHTITTWTTQAHTPGEPLFIPNPEGTEEDDGILLCVVLDGRKKKSYMLALDARNMKEVARAEMEGVMSFGFHGKHVAGGMDGILGKEGKAPVQQPGVPEW